MFFKKFRYLNICLSIALFSSQSYAAELPREQMYLPKPVVSPSQINPVSPSQEKLLISENLNHFISPISYELDRLESIEQALDEASLSKPKKTATLPKFPVKLLREVNVPFSGPKEEMVSSKKEAGSTISLTQQKKKTSALNAASANPEEIKTVLLTDIMNSSSTRPGIRLIYETSVIIQGQNIQRFLAMDEGFISVKTIDSNQIMVKALRYGGTFLNVWDDGGRRTIYIGIVFPQTDDVQATQALQSQEHEKPFRFSYSNDWSTNYFGLKNDKFKRQAYQFSQSYSLIGATPYGLFDTALGTDEFNGRPQISGHTVGLSNIPVKGVDLFSLRVFDANRYLSALTMPSTRLRGVFADITALDNLAGFSYSYGQKKSSLLFLTGSNGANSKVNSYINAFKFTLYPKDRYNQISLNAAQGTGSGHEDYLGKKAYSVEAYKKILNLYLNGEHAFGNERTSTLASAKWKEGAFYSGLNFRQINKYFTTISTLPGNQGEIGGIWTTGYDELNVGANTTVDVYRQSLFANAVHPDALNYNISGQLRVQLPRDFTSSSSLYYLHTPGEVSPRRSLTLDERISKVINFLTFKNSNIYVGATLQKIRYDSDSTSSNDRFTLRTGLQVPLTKHISAYNSYDYSWIHELQAGNDINPNVYNAGLSYRNQWTDQFGGNFNTYYRRELGAQASSYLSGEDSVGVSLGLFYSPVTDTSLFFDANTRKIWPRTAEGQAYNALDVRFGFRMSLDILRKGWDPHGTISGRVYKDKEGAGIYDKKAQGYPGVKVKVGEKEVVTDKDGFYRMNVTAKSVSVSPVAETLPSGVVFSTPTVRRIDIKPWGTTRADFGLNSQTGVYGLVFVDMNTNGSPDSGDKFMNSIKVVLDKKYTSTTDSQGAFYFRNIAEGVHTLKIDINSLPIDMIPQVKLEQKINVAEGSTYLLHVPLRVKSDSSSKK